MRHTPAHAVTNEAVVRRLVEEHPFGTLVSGASDLVASHYPFLLDHEADGLTLLTHVGRPDEELHDFGEEEVLVVFSGHHGYISPSWYGPLGTPAPTWNFSVAHCYGRPQILDADENLRVLTRLVDHFEQHVDQPLRLDQDFGARIARGTVGLRIPVDRFVCKVKMSQDKDPESQRNVLAALRSPGPYRHDALAADLERALREGGR